MTTMLAQLTGILAMIFLAIAPQQRTKRKVLIFQQIATILYTVQYWLLEAYSAVLTNIIGIIKNRIFMQYTRKNRKIPILVLLIYIIIIALSGIFTYTGIFTLFPSILSILDTYSTWQNKLKVYRIITAVSMIAWFVYNFVVNAYIVAIGNIFQIFSAVIAIVRLDVKINKDN